jgi:phage gp46-like protein
MATPTRDFALAYDPVNRRADYAFVGNDFVFDTTPASAMVFSIFADRRARPDDPLPTVVPDWSRPSTLRAMGGWVGDFLSASAGLVGSRLWLLKRRKATEATRLAAIEYGAEALAWLQSIRGYAVDVSAFWADNIATPTLVLRCKVGATTITVKRQVA